MDAYKDFSFDRVLDMLADKVAKRLTQETIHGQPRLLTIDQAASYIGRTTEAVQHLASSGKIPTVRADRRVFIDRLDLDAWIKDNKTGWS